MRACVKDKVVYSDVNDALGCRYACEEAEAPENFASSEELDGDSRLGERISVARKRDWEAECPC